MVEVIQNLIAGKRLPHGLMIVGGTSQSRRTEALKIAQNLVCDLGTGCGQCGPCLRIQSGQSESLLVVEPDGQNIKLEQARLILDFFSLASVSRSRVVIMDPAHLLNQQAANSLLKIVEEPPPGSHILCLTPSSTLMLPTLRSRLQTFRLPFAADDSASNLSEDQLELMQAAERGLQGLIEGQRAFWSELVDYAKDKESALFLSRTLQKKLRQRVVASGKIDEQTELMNWWRGLYQIENDILANMDRTLLFENFYYRMRA